MPLKHLYNGYWRGKIVSDFEEDMVLYAEHINLEQAMHGAQEFFSWDQAQPYHDDDLDLQVV